MGMTEAKKTPAEMLAEAEQMMADVNMTMERVAQLRKDAKRIQQQERRAEEAQRRVDHRKKMFEEIGQPLAGLNEAQHGIVYSAAWVSGHSSGFGEVASYYEEFAEMARQIIEAN